MFQENFGEKIKTQILHSKTFFRKLCIFFIMLKNTVQADRQDTNGKNGACALNAG
jgi:hypothetical protein